METSVLHEILEGFDYIGGDRLLNSFYRGCKWSNFGRSSHHFVGETF